MNEVLCVGNMDKVNTWQFPIVVATRLKCSESGIKFVCDDSKELDGIITHSSREYSRGNVHDKRNCYEP